MTRREGMELLVLVGTVIGVQAWSVWGDVAYTGKKINGTYTVTQTESFVKPSDKTADTTYATLSDISAWLQKAKDQKTANDASRTSAAVADQAEIDRRQAIYDAAVASGMP